MALRGPQLVMASLAAVGLLLVLLPATDAAPPKDNNFQPKVVADGPPAETPSKPYKDFKEVRGVGDNGVREGTAIPNKAPKEDQPRGPYPPGFDKKRKIVRFNDKEKGEKEVKEKKGEKKLDLPFQSAAVYVLEDTAVEDLKKSKNIKSIEDDQVRYLMADSSDSVTTVRKLLSEGPGRRLLAESIPYGLGHVQSRPLSDARAGDIHVCIIDSGYASGHPDLQGLNFAATDTTGDDCGHGTHVMGTIAAVGGNGIGVTSILPNRKVKLSTVKVFGYSNCQWTYSSDLMGAISVCQSRGAKVISMSLGGPDFSQYEKDMTDYFTNAGLLLVAAAGNDGNRFYSYPASYPSVVSVAANDENKVSALFSNYNDQVDLSAPGVGVLSTYLNDGYKALDGTSMATPHVSGVAALVWSRNQACTNIQIRKALEHMAQDLGPAGWDRDYGWGGVRAVPTDICLRLLGCNNCTAATCPAGTGFDCTGAMVWEDVLPAGYWVMSPDKTRFIVMQFDGNLVIYKSSGEALWSSRTYGSNAKRAVFQADGNVVLYEDDTKNFPVWASNTIGMGVSYAAMQNNGDFVLYDLTGQAKWFASKQSPNWIGGPV